VTAREDSSVQTMEAWLSRAGRMHPERAALVTPARNWTYAALYGAARDVAGALREQGIRPGDRVALALASEQLIVALHGCLLIGAVAVPIDLRLGEAERAPRLRGAALVLQELPRGPRGGDPVEPVELEPGAIATVMYTSGTTAGPKEVSLSPENWLWNAIGSAHALGLDPEERWLCPMPLAHVGGLSIALRSAVYVTTVVLQERFDTATALAALMNPAQRVTLVSLVPTMLSRLLDAGLQHPPTLRRVLLGGGPIAPALLDRAVAAGVPVSPSFGMTETCSQIATDGFAVLGAELSVDVGGELLVRGPSVSVGALAPDGWLHTGDLASLDTSGRLTIVGRVADTIISGGENVIPTEVEEVLSTHPGIADAAVFGRADPEWGEAVIAQVVVRDGVRADPGLAGELRALCAGRLAAFKVPKHIEFVAEIPRGATGKLQRRALR
jgi:O-succinylbenzoic acid--CoA ligase